MLLPLPNRELDATGRPLIAGILNVTPDSFSDGGKYAAPEEAVAFAVEMIAEGADIIDVGPESTRPGSRPVSADEQIARAIPVIEAIRRRDPRVAISIDTRLAPVAQAAIQAGAEMVNDVSALRDDPAMAAVLAKTAAAVVLMHRRGTPVDMQRSGGPDYDDVIGEIVSFLEERKRYAVSAGVDPARIVFDPGIGFGKRVEHNLQILRDLDRFTSLGQLVMVGASRKSFIGHITGVESPDERLAGSLACVAIATLAGASILRVHDVRASVETARLCSAVRQS